MHCTVFKSSSKQLQICYITVLMPKKCWDAVEARCHQESMDVSRLHNVSTALWKTTRWVGWACTLVRPAQSSVGGWPPNCEEVPAAAAGPTPVSFLIDWAVHYTLCKGVKCCGKREGRGNGLRSEVWSGLRKKVNTETTLTAFKSPIGWVMISWMSLDNNSDFSQRNPPMANLRQHTRYKPFHRTWFYNTNKNFFKWTNGTLSLPYEFYLGSGQEPRFLMKTWNPWCDVLGLQQISDITRRRASENQTHVLYDSAAGWWWV